MKTYTTRDESGGFVAAEHSGLHLQGVAVTTDWTDEEFEKISELSIGEKFEVDGITVERTA